MFSKTILTYYTLLICIDQDCWLRWRGRQQDLFMRTSSLIFRFIFLTTIFMLSKNTLIYYTATNLYWKLLMENNSYKDIVITSLQHFVKNDELLLYGFVIMPNHMHLLLQIPETVATHRDIQHSLMSFTAHEFKKKIVKKSIVTLKEYYVGDADREYQFWERNPLPVPIYSNEVAEQKLNYIHLNPLQEKWNLAVHPEEYYYSSAKFYLTGMDDFGMLTHYGEYFGN